MRIEGLASTVSDNFFWLVVEGQDALLVDPIDAALAIDAVRALAPARVRVVTTHGHPDHAGGNAEVASALSAQVLAPAEAETFPVARDVGLRDGDTVTVGTTLFKVRRTPGHTDCHIVLHAPGHLISGDVLFVAGAGNCRFGGDPGEHYRTCLERLADVPDGTVFYPGHDYALRNLAFCLDVEPDNAGALERRARWSDWQRADGPILSTLGEERSYNPFLRVREPGLQARMRERCPEIMATWASDPAEGAFRALRHLRDSF